MKNRELKFRVWDKSYKDWILDSDIAISNNGVLVYGRGGVIGGWHRPSSEGDFIVQQYTGLKDCNRKEIFEGDIISFSENKAPLDPNCLEFIKKYSEVYYDSGSYYIKPPNYSTLVGRVDNLSLVNEHCQIEGNVFENSELLK